MLIASLYSLIFNVNHFFSVLSLWYTHAYSNPNRCLNWTKQELKKWSYFAIDVVFGARFPGGMSLGCQLLLLYFHYLT